MTIVPAVLVALDEDRFAARDEEAGRRVVRQVVVERTGLTLELVAERRLGVHARETRRRGGAPNHPTFENLVEMTLRADEERNLKEGRAVADRIALAGTIVLAVGAARDERGAEGADGSAEEDPEAISLRGPVTDGDVQPATTAASTHTANSESPRNLRNRTVPISFKRDGRCSFTR